MKLVVSKFSHYALVWWNKLQRERDKNEKPLVETWIEMKKMMRKRYLLTSYTHKAQLIQQLIYSSETM